jgi:hypothetical protein
MEISQGITPTGIILRSMLNNENELLFRPKVSADSEETCLEVEAVLDCDVAIPANSISGWRWAMDNQVPDLAEMQIENSLEMPLPSFSFDNGITWDVEVSQSTNDDHSYDIKIPHSFFIQNRSSYQNGDVICTLTASVTLNGATVTDTIPIKWDADTFSILSFAKEDLTNAQRGQFLGIWAKIGVDTVYKSIAWTDQLIQADGGIMSIKATLDATGSENVDYEIKRGNSTEVSELDVPPMTRTLYWLGDSISNDTLCKVTVDDVSQGGGSGGGGPLPGGGDEQ